MTSPEPQLFQYTLVESSAMSRGSFRPEAIVTGALSIPLELLALVEDVDDALDVDEELEVDEVLVVDEELEVDAALVLDVLAPDALVLVPDDAISLDVDEVLDIEELLADPTLADLPPVPVVETPPVPSLVLAVDVVPAPVPVSV